MQYLLLSEDAEGVSYFAEADAPMSLGDYAPPAPAMYLTETQPVQNMLFLVLPAGWTGDMHPSPHRQYILCLEGRMRWEAGNGDIRESRPGDIILSEDINGTGHCSAVIGDQNARLAIVQI